jgi:hypothetical protein
MTQRVVASRNSANRRPIIPQNSTSLDVMLVGIGGIAIIICIMAYVLLSRYFSSDRVCKGAHPFVYTETTGMARTVPSWRGEGNRSFGALCAKRKKPGGQEQRADGSQDSENEESLWQRGPCPLSSLALGEGQGMRGHPSLPSGKPHASASAGQARNQSRIS